ncbi:MAG: Cytochrome heme domain [Thermoanaerobaculia bacterium]|nr:Cytochrome heme domain [Thermoanaerobaculia bacterium]
MTSSVALLLALAIPLAAQPLTSVVTRDQKIVKRWELPGDPHGVAVGNDGTIYAGVAKPQAVVAIDPKTGAVKQRLVLDSVDIASTKELVTMRINAAGTRLYIANGSDESTTILSLPDLAVRREITTEGEPIRDALPDPKGRYLYTLGRHVHVYDAEGEKELHTINLDDPMAIAASANGSLLAVVATEDFGNTKATSVALYDTTTFAELAREPLQTDKTIEEALFAANDQALVALSRGSLFEKAISVGKPVKQMAAGTNGQMRMAIDFGDLTSSDSICLPEGSGAQIAALASSDLLLFAERRCAANGGFAGGNRRVTPASLYGVAAYAMAYDRKSNTVIVTDRAGFLTIYKAPRAAVAK